MADQQHRDWKREAFQALKVANDQGRLVPPKRKGFTPKVRREVLAGSDGICARCEEPLGRAFEIDHIIERDLGGSDDPKNLVALHPDCHKKKTSARAPVLAHVHRIAKREAEGPKPSTFKPGRKLQGAGFRTDISKRMDGSVVRKVTA